MTPTHLDGIRMALNTVLALQFDEFEARPLTGWENRVLVRTVLTIDGVRICEFVTVPDSSDGARLAQQTLAKRWLAHLGR